ncbi:MAG: transcriptional regulator [Acidobacteriaceae bacterium]
MNTRLHAELWTSWASLLRSYAAAHGLNSVHHAIVEVSAEQITLRVNDRWMRFTPCEIQHIGESPVPFMLHEDGTVTFQPHHQPAVSVAMDIAAEQFARQMLTEAG